MLKYVLLPLIIVASLFAQNNSGASKVEVKIEAGLFLPKLGGAISNTITTADFNNDLGFSKSSASFFALETKLNYDYAPNFYINYFNFKEHADASLSKSIVIADDTYASAANITSVVDFNTVNAIIYQNFLLKGKTVDIYSRRFYPGDIEFNIGLNVKNLNYDYTVQDKDTIARSPSWIKVYEFIPLPYFGFRYYRYNFMILGDISALSFSRAKSTSAQISVDYRVVAGVYVSAGYVYEQFDVVEDNDRVVFRTSGTKLSFKYKF